MTDMWAVPLQLSGVRYCVMTNIPFDKEEASHWRPAKKAYSSRFRSAVRVDPLLKGERGARGQAFAHEGSFHGLMCSSFGFTGDWETVSACLKEAGYPQVGVLTWVVMPLRPYLGIEEMAERAWDPVFTGRLSRAPRSTSAIGWTR